MIEYSEKIARQVGHSRYSKVKNDPTLKTEEAVTDPI